MRAHRFLRACLGGVITVMSAAVLAQPYPSKPIRFLVPFAPGGIGDLTARIYAQRMSESMGQQIVVDNRPSAGMIVSAEAALKAEPDGYTILLTGNGTAVSTSLFKSLPYDATVDFIQVSTLANFDLLLLSNIGSPFNSFADVTAFARANPGKMNIGHINIGSTQSLAAALLRSSAAIDALTVPYKGSPAVINALRANDLHVAVEFIGPVYGQIKNNALRPLAIMSARRFPGLPEVPTLAESGLPNFQATSWNGLSVRAKTPQAIVERLAKEVQAAAASSDVKQKLLDLGAEAKASTPEEMRQLMSAEIVKWRAVIQQAKIPLQ